MVGPEGPDETALTWSRAVLSGQEAVFAFGEQAHETAHLGVVIVHHLAAKLFGATAQGVPKAPASAAGAVDVVKTTGWRPGRVRP